MTFVTGRVAGTLVSPTKPFAAQGDWLQVLLPDQFLPEFQVVVVAVVVVGGVVFVVVAVFVVVGIFFSICCCFCCCWIRIMIRCKEQRKSG